MSDTGHNDNCVNDNALPQAQIVTCYGPDPGIATRFLSQAVRQLFCPTAWYCVFAAFIGVTAWSSEYTLQTMLLLVFLPLVIFRAQSRKGAFLIALVYYATGARAVPGIINEFFPKLGLGASLLLWLVHISILSLPWLLMFQPHRCSPLRRAAGAWMAIALSTLPPIGLLLWGSPLMVAGLLFPGFKISGLMAASLMLALVATCTRQTRGIHLALTILVFLSIIANVTYQPPIAPTGWKAISLQFGKSPELWSDEMTRRREKLASLAMEAIKHGNHVVVFPESISGSSRRTQADLWKPVAELARAKNATVLVGQEFWGKQRTSFRNALVGYGMNGNAGEVVVSAQVPMPVGDWKFGLDDGAETNIFGNIAGNDILFLHGKRVSFSMCYEDFLFWPHRGLLLGQADLLISAANQWPSSGTSAEVRQDMSRLVLARLAGVPLLTAKNH